MTLPPASSLCQRHRERESRRLVTVKCFATFPKIKYQTKTAKPHRIPSHLIILEYQKAHLTHSVVFSIKTGNFNQKHNKRRCSKMSSRATVVELDFFGMEKDHCFSKSPLPRCLPRQRSFRDIQSAISKINPELLKSVIASGSANHTLENANQFDPNKAFSVPSSPKEGKNLFPSAPAISPLLPRPTRENAGESASLTIFYNGAVAIFDVPRDRAETILKLAVDQTHPKAATALTDQQQLLETVNGDLPIPRKRSLQRFLEKRKERLTSSISPYGCSPNTRF